MTKMKSILFIMNYSIYNTSRRKYDDQMRAVTRLGYDVWHIGVDEKSVYLCHGDEKTAVAKRKKSPFKAIDENILYISLYSSVKKILKIKNDFSYCYIRRYFFDKSTLTAIKALHKSGIKTVVEIPTYPHKNEMGSSKSIFSRAVIAFGDRYERKASDYIDLFCPMGEHTDKIYNAKALNIENGIDVENIKLREPKLKCGEFHIMALALMTYWHGYDRLITSLGEYKRSGGAEKIYIHLVGDGTILSSWRELAKKEGVDEYVIFEGKKNNEQLNEEFDYFDLGAASLGRFRSGLSVVYELKTREYMARGIPFMYATDDYVVHGFGKYCMRVPNDDTPIDMVSVVEFMKEMRKNPDARFEMRKYAKENMTFDVQFKRIFDYFQNTN